VLLGVDREDQPVGSRLTDEDEPIVMYRIVQEHRQRIREALGCFCEGDLVLCAG
jgi:hypothetical protein